MLIILSWHHTGLRRLRGAQGLHLPYHQADHGGPCGEPLWTRTAPLRRSIQHTWYLHVRVYTYVCGMHLHDGYRSQSGAPWPGFLDLALCVMNHIHRYVKTRHTSVQRCWLTSRTARSVRAHHAHVHTHTFPTPPPNTHHSTSKHPSSQYSQ